jgi:hypothetical protein
MNRPLFKRTALAAVSLALLYYSVAWAVLRCPHQESHQGHEIAVYEGPSQRQVNLDCTGPEYHTELLAGPSTTSELLRHTRDVASRVNVLFGSSSLALDQVGDVWLNTLFDKVSSATSPFGLPRYLSLSVLRF